MTRSKFTVAMAPLPYSLIENIQIYHKYISSQKNAEKKQRDIMQMAKSIDIWLKFYPEAFKINFYKTLEIPLLTNKDFLYKLKHEKYFVNREVAQRELDNYIKKIVKSPGLKIFIGKDAYILYQGYKKEIEKYKERKNDCIFFKFSRSFLFNRSNDLNYIILTELIHKNSLSSRSFSSFLSSYMKSLDEMGDYYDQIRKKTLARLYKLGFIEKLNEFKKFQIIDSGMQGGLVLPLVRILQHEGYSGSLSLFYCFPWLKKIYKAKVHTQDINLFVQLENDSIQSYYSSSKKIPR